MAPTDAAAAPGSAQTSPRRIVNDFSIQVATVNGSGSQTANLVLLRSIFQMGIPVSGKNLFPSNIAGLPTWYTIRANKHGYVARQQGDRLPGRDEPRDGARRRAVARRRGRGPLRRAAQARRAAAGPRLLSGPVRQDRRRGLQGRQAAPARQEHDLRRRALAAARDRPGADGARAPPAARQEGQGDRTEPGRARGRQPLRGRAPREAGSAGGRAARQDPGADPDRGERRGRAGLHDGRRHRRRLVSDHAVVVAARDADRVHEEVPDGQGDRQGDVRDRAGRGRDRGDRHGARRRLGRGACDDVDVGARHLADG